MREIGGYIELDTYDLPMLHEGAAALNCGRNALAYLIEAKKIRKIALPYFLCDSVRNVCAEYDVQVSFYRIGEDFLPKDLQVDEDTWIYLVSYYGQLQDEDVLFYKNKHGKVICDYAQDYYRMPVPGVDTLYTCRKYFGVSDGAFLYTDTVLERELEQDESFERLKFVLGRYERTASEFYALSSANNKFFAGEPIKKMSRLTWNLLHGINYEKARVTRNENFRILQEGLGDINLLKIRPSDGAFMYPLYLENAPEIRSKMQKMKMYIPVLWPDVKKHVPEDWLEYRYADHILPLPCDQRYGREEMEEMIKAIKEM